MNSLSPEIVDQGESIRSPFHRLYGAARAAAGAIVLTATLTGCPPVEYGTCAAPTEEPGEQPDLTLVGDSITNYANSPAHVPPIGAIQETFGAGYDIHVEAQDGQTIQDMMDEIQEIMNNPLGTPSILVLNLGTNNMRKKDLNWEVAYDQMIDTVKSIPCVVLVTVNERTDEHLNSAESTIAAGINQKIAEMVDIHKNMYMVDWNEDWGPEMGFTPTHPQHYFTSYFPPNELPPEMLADYPEGVWAGDGIHNSPEGSIEMVRRIQEVIDQHGHDDILSNPITLLSDNL